jgi:hypothetical protein
MSNDIDTDTDQPDMPNDETEDKSTDSSPDAEIDTDTTDLPDDGTEDDTDTTGNNKEAARYRHRAKAAEAENATLRTRLETMQRTEAERLAGKHLAKGQALWAGNTALADLLDAEGNVDAQKVTERAQQVRDEYGIQAPRSGLHVPREGYSPGPGNNGGGMIDVVMGKNR